MKRRLVVLVLPLLLAGCFGNPLDSRSDTKLGVVCGFLAFDGPTILLQAWGDGPHVADAAVELGRVAGRPVQVPEPQDAPELPRQDLEALREWADKPRTWTFQGMVLHVLWVDLLPDPHATGAQIGPGAIAVSVHAVQEGAQRLGVTEQDVATTLVLHHMGHALGLVNRGVPVQNPSIQEREGTPGHATHPEELMHHGWEDVRNMTWHGPYSYSADDLTDWEGARHGVCA